MGRHEVIEFKNDVIYDLKESLNLVKKHLKGPSSIYSLEDAHSDFESLMSDLLKLWKLEEEDEVTDYFDKIPRGLSYPFDMSFDEYVSMLVGYGNYVGSTLKEIDNSFDLDDEGGLIERGYVLHCRNTYYKDRKSLIGHIDSWLTTLDAIDNNIH